MADDEENFSCEAHCVNETDQALLCELEDGQKVWIPKSQVHDDSEVYDKDENAEGTLVVKGWWARKKGLL